MADERRVLASDLSGLVFRLGAYDSGKYFYLNKNGCSSPNQKDDPAGLNVEHRFWDEVHRRLEPLQDDWSALRQNLFETGTAYVDKDGKPQLNLRAQLTQHQVTLYDRLNSLVAHTDLEVVLP